MPRDSRSAARSLTAYDPRAVAGREFPVGRGPVQVIVTPDNRYVIVANQGTEKDPDDTSSIIDTTSFTVVATVKTDKGAHGVTVDNSGTFAYIANSFADTVSVVDIAKRKVTETVKVGKKPNGITFMPAR